MSAKPNWVAAPDEGFVALQIPRAMIPPLPPEATGHLIRIRSAEGFKAFITTACDAAAAVWPEIAQDMKDILDTEH